MFGNGKMADINFKSIGKTVLGNDYVTMGICKFFFWKTIIITVKYNRKL